MKLHVFRLAVPIVGLATCLLGMDAHGQAPGQIPVTDVYYSSAGQTATAASAIGPCNCNNESCSCGIDLGAGLADLKNRSGQAFFGAEWLHVRANFSESVAWLERDIANFTDTFHELDFDYKDSYSLYGGYRTCDCCGEVRFAFTRYRGDICMQSPAATDNTQYIAPLEVNAVQPGQRVTSCADVDVRSYDLDFGRTIPLGSPLDDCSCCWCPAWDLQWFAGVRYADVGWLHGHASFDNELQLMRTGITRMDFDGIGPRVGMKGRRYIGRSGKLSVFAKGTISLLLGDVDYTTTLTDVQTPGIVQTQRASFTRVIPVTDIELGVSAHIRDSITVSSGYLLSSWHDLGMGDQSDFGLQLEYDDANILSFDGFFVRAEVTY